jgi:5-methylthioadenosine/S-adenosylhomocysteine deaminase
MRTAFAVQRGLDGGLCSRDLLKVAIVDAALSCGRDARTGSITPGKVADVILLCADVLAVFPVTDRPDPSSPCPAHPIAHITACVPGRRLAKGFSRRPARTARLVAC